MRSELFRWTFEAVNDNANACRRQKTPDRKRQHLSLLPVVLAIFLSSCPRRCVAASRSPTVTIFLRPSLHLWSIWRRSFCVTVRKSICHEFLNVLLSHSWRCPCLALPRPGPSVRPTNRSSIYPSVRRACLPACLLGCLSCPAVPCSFHVFMKPRLQGRAVSCYDSHSFVSTSLRTIVPSVGVYLNAERSFGKSPGEPSAS